MIKGEATRIFDQIKDIKYQIGEIQYQVRASQEELKITIDHPPLQQRFTAVASRTYAPLNPTQQSLSLFECFYRQYICSNKQPRSMIQVDPNEPQNILIEFTYPGAPIRQLRFPCHTQEIQNPKLYPYQITLSKMAEAAMLDVLKRYQPKLENQMTDQMSRIKSEADCAISRLQQKEMETLNKFQVHFELVKIQIQKGIKDFKEHLEGQVEDFWSESHARTIKIAKEAALKACDVEQGLSVCQQNQTELYNKWEDIEGSLLNDVESIKDQLEALTHHISLKVDADEVQSILERLKLLQPKSPPAPRHQEACMHAEDITTEEPIYSLQEINWSQKEEGKDLEIFNKNKSKVKNSKECILKQKVNDRLDSKYYG